MQYGMAEEVGAIGNKTPQKKRMAVASAELLKQSESD
jgi:hypothetical protein